jgi:ubiquitin-conjugating enzyme E2 Z
MATEGSSSKQAGKDKETSKAALKELKWDPFLDMDNRVPTSDCLKRVRSDLKSLIKEPLQGIYCVPDELYNTVIHALIVGPFETPYEGGFFYFIINCPDDYPHQPPKVKLMTTGGGKVRFNPNLYASGKVCVSILGTWSGPSWTPVYSIATVLLSIQSLMNENPYYNEPGFETSNVDASNNYNNCIRHDTLKAAVCEMAAQETSQHCQLPDKLKSVVLSLFPSFFDSYEIICLSNLHKAGQVM